MSRCAQGTPPTKFDRKAPPTIVPALRASGALSRSRVVALDQLAVLLVQRQPPDDLAGALAGGPQALGELVVVAHQARVGRPQRDDHRAGQRRQVDDPLRSLGDRMTEAVGQHQPALGVRVVDLDRPAVGGGDDVPGLDRPPAGQVLGRAHDRDQLDRAARAGRSRRRPRARPRRRTCRTSSRPSSAPASARCRRCRTSRPCPRSRAAGQLARRAPHSGA